MGRTEEALRAGLVVLVRPRIEDCDEFLAHVDASRSHHAGLVDPPATRKSFAAYVRRVGLEAYDGFLVRSTDSDRLVGVVNLNSIVRASLESASLGYYRLSGAGPPGAMRTAVARVIDHAFSGLGLHRLEANIQPGNTSSLELVTSLGFRREGFSPDYLRIGGAWRDHERWAITSDEWRSPL